MTFIDPILSPQSRTAGLRLEVPNRENRLKPGMFVQGEIGQKSERILPAVPASAVMWTGRRSVIYVRLPDSEVPVFEMREVELSSSSDEFYAVISGLEAGEEVVVNGTFTVDAAAQLNGKASMMNREIVLKNQTEKGEKAPDFRAKTGEKQKLILADLQAAYLELKDAFTASDSKAVSEKIEQFSGKLPAFQAGSPKNPKAAEFWRQIGQMLRKFADDLEKNGDLENRRTVFAEISEQMIGASRAFGSAEPVFVQFCPMARQDKGAFWLSRSAEIRNPYYGEKMLSCGEVKEEIGGR